MSKKTDRKELEWNRMKKDMPGGISPAGGRDGAVVDEPWLQAERIAARSDRWLLGRPKCVDCGRHIAGERYFPLEDGSPLCPDCVKDRMVEID